MNESLEFMRVKEAPRWLPNHSSRILTAGAILALLYSAGKC